MKKVASVMTALLGLQCYSQEQHTRKQFSLAMKKKGAQQKIMS